MVGRSALGLVALALLSSCKEDAPVRQAPPPRVGVSVPVRQDVTRYFTATGSASAVNSIDLVARVPGYLFDVKYTDGAPVAKGQPLFTIEPAPYVAKLAQAQAQLASVTAGFTANDAELGRQAQLGASQFSSRSTVDQARAKRDSASAEMDKARADVQVASINLSYTHVTAPFDGVASARLASVGDLVGMGSVTKLATVVQLDPIYVTFNVGERDVLQIRTAMARSGKPTVDLTQVPIEVGLANEDGFPHAGTLDYVAPSVDPVSGTLLIRGVLSNPNRTLLPGMFVRMRVPLRRQTSALLIPDSALGSDLGGRYALVVTKDGIVEQRRVRPGPLTSGLRLIEEGLTAEDQVIISGNQRAIPGLKVTAEPATIAADK